MLCLSTVQGGGHITHAAHGLPKLRAALSHERLAPSWRLKAHYVEASAVICLLGHTSKGQCHKSNFL